MLAALRENSRNVLIYVLFGVIIAVFVINFGPGSRGVGTSAAASSYAAEVAGTTISEQDFRMAYVIAASDPFLGRSPRIKGIVMDKLIERELLADEAERLGFKVSDKEVEDMIAAGHMIILGGPRPVDAYAFKDGHFDYDRFKNLSQNQFGLSVARLIDVERRELLADKVRELLRSSAKVTPEEIKQKFEDDGRQVNLEYVRFAAKATGDESEPSQAEIDAYIKSHADELKKQYDERAFLYKKLDKQAQLRRILVPAAKPEEQDAAKKKADEIAAKVKGGASFAEVAKKESGDEPSRKKGGLLGWRKKQFSGLGQALEDKVFAAKKGDILGPEKTDRGYEIIKVEDFREGDVPLEVVEREMAAEAVGAERGKKVAKNEAEAMLQKVKNGEKLETLVPKVTDDKAEKNPDALKLQETGLFSRHGERVEGIGLSKDLAKKAFDLKPGEVAGPFEVANSYVIVRCKEHKEPDMADFEKRKADLARKAEREKWREVVTTWSQERCNEVKSDGRIKVNSEVLTADGRAGSPDKLPYQPCAGTRLF